MPSPCRGLLGNNMENSAEAFPAVVCHERYKVRSYSVTMKGEVVNGQDSFRLRRPSCMSSLARTRGSIFIPVPENLLQQRRNSTTVYPVSTESDESESSEGPSCFKVTMLGAAGVGKTSLVSQFIASHESTDSRSDSRSERKISILLDKEESELMFYDFAAAELPPEEVAQQFDADAYVVVYSVTDRATYRRAKEILSYLRDEDLVTDTAAVILVGNKTDLVRSRNVTIEDGERCATKFECKFIETSDWMSHNVHELLVGILSQIRLRQKSSNQKNGGKSKVRQYRGSKTSSGPLTRSRSFVRDLFRRNVKKTRSCSNLFVE